MNVCYIRMLAMTAGDQRSVKIEDAPHEPEKYIDLGWNDLVLADTPAGDDPNEKIPQLAVCKHCGCVYVEDK